MRKVLAVALALALTAAASGCGGEQPYVESRQVLGTAVSITAYPGGDAARAAVASAFDRMAAVEKALSPYDPSSAIAAMNADPYTPHRLPLEAMMVFTTTEGWQVGAVGTDGTRSAGFFSPTLWGVTRLYAFGASETVPAPDALERAVRDAGRWEREGETFRFVAGERSRADTGSAAADSPGLDFGGASKGLALDLALQQLGGVHAGLISAGSSTLAFGAKPDGEPWRVGIEDPRETGRIIAVVTATERPDATDTPPPVPSLSVSTSGDYQLYFERAGVRYHHILDPATGRPARGLRSLTVFGRMSGLDADILSTALFVMGRDRALTFAREHAIGVYLVDDDGKPSWYVPASRVGIALETKADPRP